MKKMSNTKISATKNFTNKPIFNTLSKISGIFPHFLNNNFKPKNNGVKIVLTASAIEMSDFNLNPFIAFSAGFPLGIFSKLLLRKKLYPETPPNQDSTAKFAPYGLRKVEALLMEEFGKENVVTVHPSNLQEFVGPETKIIGISTMDPLGIGFVSRTYTSILGLNGKPVTLIEFESLLSKLKFKGIKPKIILGGSGAWQISSANMQDKLGIDTILIGQAEHSMIEIFKKILNDTEVEKVVTMKAPKANEVPIIKNPSLYGTVEITRGCGRGCKFCSPSMRGRYSFSLEHILKEVKLNAKNGTRAILLQTDDLFLYKSKQNFIPNRKAIIELIQEINKVEGIEYLQIAHASLAPVVYDKNIVEGIAPALVEKSVWYCNRNRCASIEVGIETGSSRLMGKYMRGKMLPYKPEQWQDVVTQAIETLNDNKIYPLATLVLGLPGEKREDVIATIELLDKLKDTKIFYVPLLFTSEEESFLRGRKHKNLRDFDDLQWNVLSKCWKHNIDTWSPEIRKIIMFSSLLLYPYYRWKHGKNFIRPILNFSGLGSPFLNEKLDTACQPQYCNLENDSKKH